MKVRVICESKVILDDEHTDIVFSATGGDPFKGTGPRGKFKLAMPKELCQKMSVHGIYTVSFQPGIEDADKAEDLAAEEEAVFSRGNIRYFWQLLKRVLPNADDISVAVQDNELCIVAYFDGAQLSSTQHISRKTFEEALQQGFAGKLASSVAARLTEDTEFAQSKEVEDIDKYSLIKLKNALKGYLPPEIKIQISRSRLAEDANIIIEFSSSNASETLNIGYHKYKDAIDGEVLAELARNISANLSADII